MTSFLEFAKLCQKAEGIRGSLEKIDLVAAFLAQLDDAELAISSNFIMGRIFPSTDMILGVGPSILYEALAKACGCTSEVIQDALRETGDAGLVASVVAQNRRPLNLSAFSSADQLTISDVYERFLSISRASGKRSQDAKVKNLQFLFGEATPLEAQYLARLAMEDLRIGIGEG